MSVAIDANVLLYASDQRSPRHSCARDLLERLAAEPGLVYLFWPVAMAYLRIATPPAVFKHPLDPQVAQANLSALLERAHIRCPGEDPGFWTLYQDTVGGDVVGGDVVGGDVVRGNLVPDAHIAALMRQHGVSTIWTADRDFKRFPYITARDPYVEASR
jgi:uncharacterized protein